MTRVLFLLLTTTALLLDCEPLRCQKQDIVARIADKYTITFPELREYTRDYQYFYRFNRNVVVAIDTALSDMVINRMKIIDFFNRGLDKKRELLEGRILRALNEELVIDYQNREFHGKHVTDDAVQDVYRQMGKEVIYRQIVLLKPKNASAETLDSLKSLAKRITMRIGGGADFSALAKQYSQDVKTSNQGGLMPPLNWKMSLSSPVYDAIFHLAVNEASIVESKEAIQVVKVDKIDTVDVPPYSKAEEDIRRALGEKYASVAAGEFDQMKKSLVNERTVQWNEKGIRELLRWSKLPKFYEKAYSDTLGYAISHGNNFLVLKYSKNKVDLKEYLRLINEDLTLGNAVGIGEDDLKGFILEAIRTDKLIVKARELNLEKDTFNPKTTDPFLENGIIRAYNSQVIEKQIPPATEEALRAFYQANKDSLYYQLKEVNIYALIDSSKSAINEMKAKLDQCVPFEKLASDFLVKSFVRKRDGTIASYFSIEPPYLGEAAFKLKFFETAGPIEYVDSAKVKQYALIECKEIREEKQLTYDDVKKTIASDFADYYRNKIAQSVAEQLKKEYAYTIYKDTLQQDLLSTGVTPPR